MSTKDANPQGSSKVVEGESESNLHDGSSSLAASNLKPDSDASASVSSETSRKPKVSYGKAFKSAPESYTQAPNPKRPDRDRSDEADCG